MSAGRAAAPEPFKRIDALIRIGLRLAASAPTGRVALARLAAAIELDWIPRPWGEDIAAVLARAQATAPQPMALREVERLLRGAWGEPPAAVLDELEPEPVAVTPGAQIHRAQLDGQAVAIKVLRPNLAAAVRQDLVLLESLAGPLAMAFPALDAPAALREVRERLLEELDFEHEATIQRRFHRALRGHPHLTVPAPVTRLSHEGVLVSEWVEGVPFLQAPDPDRAARQLLLFGLGAARFGTIHADLKPEDVLVLDDGSLAILDFGATRTLERDRAELTVEATEAFAADDAEQLGAVLTRLGTLPAGYGAAVLELARHALGELAGPAPSRLDGAAVVAARDRLLDRPEVFGQLLADGRLAPADLWPARGVGIMFATIARLGATGPWLELALAALREGWQASID